MINDECKIKLERINEFKNEYAKNKITKNNFIDDYFREAIRKYNKFQQDRRIEELDRRLEGR